MNETNANYVTRRKFRMVVSVLSLLLLGAAALLVAQRKNWSQWWFTGTDTPILVRGGAMTAFTVGKGAPKGWGTASGSTYCINVDTSYIQFDIEADRTSKSWPNLTPPWEVDIYGQSGANGLKFEGKASDCTGSTGLGKTSVRLSPMNGGGFYQTPPLADAPPRKGNVRFRDTSCGPDEDACERMGKVVIKLSTGLPTVPPCLDGDCTVRIGKPQ
jgi:hypothetical protein